MALDQEYFKSLGLEVAKKKYYNAARVESVIEELHRRSAQLVEENASLHERLDSLSYGREEIGDAILSAKTLAQHLLSEAQEKADLLLAEAQEKAARLVSEAQERADALDAESEEKRQAVYAYCAERESEAVERVRNCYVQLRELHLSSVAQLDEVWQRFLCSLDGGEAPGGELPDDLGDKITRIAASLDAIGGEDEDGE